MVQGLEEEYVYVMGSGDGYVGSSGGREESAVKQSGFGHDVLPTTQHLQAKLQERMPLIGLRKTTPYLRIRLSAEPRMKPAALPG